MTSADNESLIIDFDNNDKLTISLDPDNPKLVAPEIAIFTDTNENWYVFE